MDQIPLRSNNIPVNITLVDKNGVINLTGARVTALLNYGSVETEKTVFVTDPALGKCRFLINREDIPVTGFYFYRILIEEPGDKVFPSFKGNFQVVN